MPYTVDDIFRDSDTKHALHLFAPNKIAEIEVAIFDKGGKPYIKCLGSDRDRPAKPEEIVRQLWIKYIIEELHYPKDRIQIEKPVWFGSGVSDKAADIVIRHKDDENPYIIFEVKKPKRKDGIQQLKSYCNADGAPVGVWSNGGEKIIYHREEPNIFISIDSIPTVDQTLQDIIGEQWTIDKLIAENRLVKENLTFKSIILDLENLVLANAKGIDDSFDEIFKLIYAKLYDEWAAVNIRARNRKIQFRIYGESTSELKTKITGLLRDAARKWEGIFKHDENIVLSDNHLYVCVSFLQGIKLFNSNLVVIDEAFEYLVTEIAKGKKGQYFTPRYVIDMCVKMMNPKINEYIIDPACGSAGFTVHTIFYVARGEFTAEGLPREIVDYAGQYVYGIDSSPRSVKISKAINLIAGDGKTNIYELNSLESDKWDETGRTGFRNRLLRIDDPTKNDENQKLFRQFNFDLVLTNPPFAGNINEKDILKQYKLAEKNGKTVAKMGRDILFIEKCLNLLRPGGRMAIVLPQGRLNNSSDLPIRNFIFDKARLLAVVGLDVNTFKPHTGTKTSVLFLQKYTENELADISEAVAKHADEWDNYWEKELHPLMEAEALTEDEIPDLVKVELSVMFDDTVSDSDKQDEDTDIEEEKDIETLKTLIKDMENDIAAKGIRFKGRAEVLRVLAERKKEFAALELTTQVVWILNDAKSVESIKNNWLLKRAAEELDYPIFFAVSQKPGKDSSGGQVYILDADTGRPILDDHGHRIIDHDCNEIADAFIEFAKAQDFDFWGED
ncbi:MAG: N-6 DNA methylase [Oscillospiraceae bacterium]|jgi:type I restriction enzyme M protein|nr:N-6 DNA methylase [Oscillospiraceae bacterium]